MSKPEKGIMDADSLAYQIAYYYQMEVDATGFEPMEDEEDSDFENSSYEWAIAKVDKYLKDLRNSLKLDEIELHISGTGKNHGLFKERFAADPRDNFRYFEAEKLPGGYKANRPKETSKYYFDVMRAMAIDFNAYLHDHVETDDAVVYLKNQDPDNLLLIALDKDVLEQTEGVHWNYGKSKVHVTQAPNHIYYKYHQAIVGDPGDGYGGVPGIGLKKVPNFIHPDMTEKELWEGVLEAYNFKNLGEEVAIATMRLASMTQLKSCILHTDKPNEYELELWTPDNL